MSDEQVFSVGTAREAAQRDALAGWVTDFLSSDGSDNAALAEELANKQLWWLGPVRLPFSELHRLAGPPDEPVLAELKDDDVERAEDMAESVEDGWDPPPLIVAYRDGQLVVEDGNHRIEGLRRAGDEEGWSVVAFEDPEERDRFSPPGDPTT